MLMFDKFLLENMLEAEVKKFTEKRLFWKLSSPEVSVKFSQNSQEKTFARLSFLINLESWRLECLLQNTSVLLLLLTDPTF